MPKISAEPVAAAFAATDVLLGNVSGVTSQISGTVLAAFLATATLAAGTITTSQPLTLTQAWNAAGVTFTGLLVNPSGTSAAGSLIADFQFGGSSKLSIQKDGSLTLGNGKMQPGSSAAGYITLFKDDNFTTALFQVHDSTSDGINIAKNTLPLSWGSDLFAWRDAANTLALRNGVNAQKQNVYETFTDASNYKRLGIYSNSIFTEGAGSGVAGTVLSLGSSANVGIDFYANNASVWRITAAGMLVTTNDNAVDIGASGATRPRNIYAATNITAGGGVIASAAIGFNFGANGSIAAPGDGIFNLLNSGGTTFARLQFGGTTSSFPALKRSSATLIARLADDSADATFQSGQIIVSGIATDAAHTDSSVCQDTTTHQFYAGSGAAGICLGTSSIRYKEDVTTLNVGLKEILALEPVSYKYKKSHGIAPGKTLYGFIAEQGQEALPVLVGPDSDGQPQSFDHMGVVAVLVSAMQEQQVMIEDLQRSVDELRATRH